MGDVQPVIFGVSDFLYTHLGYLMAEYEEKLDIRRTRTLLGLPVYLPTPPVQIQIHPIVKLTASTFVHDVFTKRAQSLPIRWAT